MGPWGVEHQNNRLKVSFIYFYCLLNKMKAAACSVCKQRVATHSCIKCGSLVCEVCYDAVTGLCVACRRGKFLKK